MVRRHARERGRPRAQRRARVAPQLHPPGRPLTQRTLLGARHREPRVDHGPRGPRARAAGRGGHGRGRGQGPRRGPDGQAGSPRVSGRLPGALDALFPESLRRTLVELRRDLHEHPELSGREERTAEVLHAGLGALKPIRLERVAGTGLVARIRGQDSGLAPVAVRGDTDALPITENTGLPFASRTAGVMHACGHDVHAAWAVGAAYLLTARPAPGDVLIVLQPAEETGRGALGVLES